MLLRDTPIHLPIYHPGDKHKPITLMEAIGVVGVINTGEFHRAVRIDAGRGRRALAKVLTCMACQQEVLGLYAWLLSCEVNLKGIQIWPCQAYWDGRLEYHLLLQN